MKTETTLIGTSGGMAPLEAPTDWARHNAGLKVHFYEVREPKLDKAGQPLRDATGALAEHVAEHVRIVASGDALTESCQPVDDGIRERFAAQYQTWKSGAAVLEGTQLADWGMAAMTPRFIRDLEGLFIETVQDLAGISDAFVNRIADGRIWRQKAKAWLEAHPKQEELSEIAKLKAENEEFKRRFEALEKAAEKKPVHKSAAKSEAADVG